MCRAGDILQILHGLLTCNKLLLNLISLDSFLLTLMKNSMKYSNIMKYDCVNKLLAIWWNHERVIWLLSTLLNFGAMKDSERKSEEVNECSQQS